MATRTATAKPVTPVAEEIAEIKEIDTAVEAAAPAPVDPFADLEPATELVFTRNSKVPPQFDPNTISAKVRADLEKSYALGWEPRKGPAIVDKDGAVIADEEGNPTFEELAPLGKNVYMTQRFPSSTLLMAYVDQATKYAKYKGWTFRKNGIEMSSDGIPMTAKVLADAKILRFCAKPGESRGTKE